MLAGGTSSGGSLLTPSGLVADTQRQWLITITLWMMIVVVPVFILAPLVAWRYRRRNTRSTYQPDWQSPSWLEVLIWGVPCVIVAGMAWLIVARETPLGRYRELHIPGPPVKVDVVALDWKWLFIYPGSRVASVGELVIPRGREVVFRLTSDSNMQSFFIPALGSQIYAMTGMVTALHLVADRTGQFMGENTQFNGFKFQDDKFTVSVLEPGAFADWTRTQAGNGRTLDAAAYRTLAQRGTTRDARKALHVPEGQPFVYAVDPALFGQIVQRYNPDAMAEMAAMSD